MKHHLSRRAFVTALGLGALPLSGSQRLAPGGGSSPTASGTSWLELEGRLYGAKPNDRGPIGGGNGYLHTVAKGDFTVEDFPGLLDALSRVKEGQVIFIPSGVCIDLTTHIYIEEFVLDIPPGITLAGDRGHEGAEGALFTSDALKTPIMVRVGGPDVRITGLRFRGPNAKRYMEHHRKSFGPGGGGHSYYYRFPVSRCISTEFPRLTVDNCEISAFSRCAVFLGKGDEHHVHHNYIHHCQYNGLGYGVSHNASVSLTEYNLFETNRHSIAGTGRPGSGYVARHNVVAGESLSHCFDMHGGRDRKDNTNIAGTSIEITNNTFYPPERPIAIRGEPESACRIQQNWFVRHATAKEAVFGLSEKTVAMDNAYGEHPETAS